MRTYILRRVLLIIPTLFLVTIIVFLSVRFVPGDVIDMMVAEMGVTEDREGAALRLRQQMGLDKPIYVQYGRWVGSAFRGDLGESLWSGRSITSEMGAKLPISLELGIMAMITALIIALPIGIYSAIRQDTGGDYVGRSFAILCISLPGFWLGTMVIVFPSVWWNWTPSMEYIPLFSDPGTNLVQFIIPAVIMGMVMSGNTMRMTRTMMLEVLRQDYIRTAWSKGLVERVVVTRHALKNALIPVVTIIGLQVPILIGGTAIMEQIFVLPGVGRYLVEALGRRDYPILSGINLIMASFVLIVNLVVDLVYAYLDPRVQYR
ncbi:MAG TPA: ABC transporter permease [Dehalococcoidales bacterium]